MDLIFDILKAPFTWGLILGLIFTGIVLWSHWKTKREFTRYKRHLSDKLEIEADAFTKLKGEREQLAKENENLRKKVSGSSMSADSAESLQRELEIFARAEKTMIVSAPGFAAPWERAKNDAYEEVNREEEGSSLSKRIFRKFFPGSSDKSSAEIREMDHVRELPAGDDRKYLDDSGSEKAASKSRSNADQDHASASSAS